MCETHGSTHINKRLEIKKIYKDNAISYCIDIVILFTVYILYINLRFVSYYTPTKLFVVYDFFPSVFYSFFYIDIEINKKNIKYMLCLFLMDIYHISYQ